MLRDRAREERLKNIVPVLGTATDPRLPRGALDLVLLVDVYHEFSHPEEMLEAIRQSLKPDGRVAVAEFRAEDPDVPIKPLHKMTVKQVKREMAAVGLEFVERKDILPIQHYLVFQRPIDS